MFLDHLTSMSHLGGFGQAQSVTNVTKRELQLDTTIDDFISSWQEPQIPQSNDRFVPHHLHSLLSAGTQDAREVKPWISVQSTSARRHLADMEEEEHQGDHQEKTIVQTLKITIGQCLVNQRTKICPLQFHFQIKLDSSSSQI